MTQPLTAPCARPGCGVIRVQRPNQCNQQFRRVKYCCHECSVLATVKHPKPAPLRPRICKGKRCRIEFQPKRRNHVYCCDRCRLGGPAIAKPKAVYDGGGQVLPPTRVYDVRHLPADEGRLWT